MGEGGGGGGNGGRGGGGGNGCNVQNKFVRDMRPCNDSSFAN